MTLEAHQDGARLAALLSPGFLAALALLLWNDLLLKPALDNWLTGKLSDVAGLFVVVVLGTALRPGRGLAVVLTTVAGFTLWKSPASQPLIDGWNALGLVAIDRVVDWTDLAALAVTPAARQYAATAAPLAPETFRYPVLAMALLAILGTSTVDRRTSLYQRSDYTFQDGRVVFTTTASRDAALNALGADLVLRMTSGGDLDGLEARRPCGKEGGRGHFGSASVALLPAGDRVLLHLRTLTLCTLKTEVVRPDAAIGLFQKEVLDPLGGWRRR
jgi:hypothetical protein